MDRHCDNCIHRGYVVNHPNWCFCMNDKDQEIKEVATEWLNHINRLQIRLGLEKTLKSFPKGQLPSGQLVQTGFYELYGKHCSYHKVSKYSEVDNNELLE